MDVQTLFPGIDKQAPIPLYYQLKQQILRHISEGRCNSGFASLRGGDLRKAENQPSHGAAGHGRPDGGGVSDAPEGEGNLCSPTEDPGGRFFQSCKALRRRCASGGLVPSTRVLRLALIDGDSRSCDALGIPEGDRVILLERLRFANGEPIVWVETYLPYQRFPRLLAVDFERQSLYRELEHTYLVPVERVVREIEAVNAAAREAELLEIQKNAALCFVKTIAYDYDGVPVEYSRAHYRGDRNRFSVELRRT